MAGRRAEEHEASTKDTPREMEWGSSVGIPPLNAWYNAWWRLPSRAGGVGPMARGRAGEPEPERGSLTRDALKTHLAPMSFDNTPTDVESQSKPDLGACLYRRVRDALIAFPDALLVLKRHTWAIVMDPNDEIRVARAHADLDGPSGRRVADGVREVIGEHLAQAICVGQDTFD